MFNLRGELRKEEFKFELLERTRHINERLYRLRKNIKLNKLNESVYKIYVVDRGEGKGLEIHLLCYDATVIVVSYEDHKLITILNEGIGRLKKRYGNEKYPKYLYECALRNSEKSKQSMVK